MLAGPPNNTLNIPIDTIVSWYSTPGATSYDFIMARSADFNSGSIVYNVTSITDTFYQVTNLTFNALHYWKVRAKNQYGYGNYSEAWRFKTVLASDIDDQELIPSEYALEQNYPNPFNPITNITVKIASAGFTSLKIYNLLGQEVADVVNEELNPGTYNFSFDASELSSGIYMYRIVVNGFTASKKMILMK
jgi:hypothetical protein